MVKIKVNILPIIIHYNQPNEAEKIYQKFKSDGFDHVILCDNGSNITKPSRFTNFSIGENNFFREGIVKCFDFCEKKYEFNYIFHTSTSLYYSDNINYKKLLENTIDDALSRNLNIGFLSFYDEKSIERHQPYLKKFQSGISFVNFSEGTHACISKNLYFLLKKNKKAYFEKKFVKGWGIDFELIYNAFINDFISLRINDAKVSRDSEIAYQLNLRSETREEYRISSRKMLDEFINKKYGSIENYELIIENLYKKMIVKNKNKIRGYSYAFKDNLMFRLMKELIL